MPTAASVRKTPRENQINIRATDEERAVIDYAASLVNKNRTDFIIELAYQEAKNIILDQRLFVLDNERYDSFITQLEAPVQNAEGRERLMAVKPRIEIKVTAPALLTDEYILQPFDCGNEMLNTSARLLFAWRRLYVLWGSTH